MNDAYFMKTALAMAAKGQGCTSPNPMVGAVVVKNDLVVGRGWHRAAGRSHAEVEAIADAGPDAMGATLYVTLEPCNHTGRTPPCTKTILAAGIRRVVVAMNDPNPDVAGGGNQMLVEHGIDVTTGVCEFEARTLNEVFIKYITTKRPFVLLKAAVTLDGYIAGPAGDSKWITGEASRRYVHELRHGTDAVLVGVGTVKQDNPRLTTRLQDREGRDPVRIILDSNLSMPPDSEVLRHRAGSVTLIACRAGAPSKRRKTFLEQKGIDILDIPLKDGLLDLTALMDVLGERGVTSVLIEGGGRVFASAFREGIVDKACWFLAPKIMGGSDGTPVCRGKGAGSIRDSIHLQRVSFRRFGDDLMVEGYL